MTEQTKTAKPRKSEQPRLTLTVPAEIVTEIETFMANISPAMRKTIDAASMMENGKPHPSGQTAFLAYAVRLALGKGEQAPRTFGAGIEKTVSEIMERNLIAHAERPENWWELTAIGSSLLRDAGHNPNSVKRWLEENGDRLNEHHAAIGITDPMNHNRKAGKARKSQEQCE